MNIVYLCNYMLDDVLALRKNQNTYAQAANNKINQIRTSLELNGHEVSILSNALMNNRSFKWFKGFNSKLDKNLFYISIFDFPLLNTLSSILFMCFRIFRMHRKKKIDYILFWNYKPEVALVAYICKWMLGIRIIVDYEDGYFTLQHIGRKRHIFNFVEKVVSKYVDGAILISEQLISRINDKPYVILNGLTNQKVLNYKGERKKSDVITLMYAGGLDYERGIDVLIQALTYTNQPFILKVSGKGPLSDMFEKEKDPRIQFLGFLDYEESIKQMYESDILINPQREKIEFAQASFPSKIFDYIATNSLIISSNIGNMRRFSNNSFYIYEEDDPKELAARIDEAIQDIQSNVITEKKLEISKIRDKFLPKNVGRDILQTLMKSES
ncbi:glycosyltransferase family 4 protein [Paenibacillus sp. SYP-B3998]|uniref:Glycosyltransferase family 4 protein n=1 Tax=Paenibacillus sp. SYP-B3998 TaxID=2678564 RepID=A0A6G3ZY62_9BACL|nr:glycosyltransferase [Paenibacillus sp. SYP-B3998]NEW07153.1 glycosyltransferase family 4 protein [Paenibacillus sp. SYP-B3998]